MNQTLLLRLDPAAEQHGALRATMERFNEAANWVAGVAFARHTASKYLLQKEVYGELRFRFHLSAQEASPFDPMGALGVDLGIVRLAVDSDGTTYDGTAVERTRRIHAHRRWNLQRKRTRSARRKLRRLSGRQARFQRNTNHCISKRIVQNAQDTARVIALEDLSGIRKRCTVRRRQRARFANWGFHQLRSFIEYKARLAGVPVLVVDPRTTSRTCSRCGHCDKTNRRDQATFLCGSCGFRCNADHNAALMFKARAEVMLPNGSDPRVSGQCLRDKPTGF